MNKQLVLTILLCATVLAQFNNCPSFYGGDLLQSGKNTIMRGPESGNPQREFQAPINFKILDRQLEIAITTSTIGDYNPLPDYGYNYIVSAARKDNSNFIIYKLFMENNKAWSTIQVSYLVSARNDMAIGNFQVPIQQWSLGAANVYSVSYTLNKVLSNGPYKVAAFISGFSTTDSQFALTIVKKSYDQKARSVDVGFFCSANPAVLTLTIAYIVYQEIHPVFEITYDLTPRAQIGSYQIAGPVNFQPNKRIQYNEWRVENRNLACNGNQCDNTCILRQKCADLNGNIYQGQCTFCPPGVVFQFGRCSRKCGANQIYLRNACACVTGYERRGTNCVKKASCAPNEFFSNDQKKCLCKPEFYRVGTECLACPAGAVATPDGLSCTCSLASKIYKPTMNACLDRCNQFQQWGDNRCQCVNSYSWWNQGCRKCPDDSFVTADQTTCLCKKPNSFYDPEKNVCLTCGPYSSVNGLKNGCICDFGYEPVNGVCTQIKPKCPPGQISENSQCICEKTFAHYGTCKKCPDNSFTNTQRTRCICVSSTAIFRDYIFQCVECPANSRPNGDLSLCTCNPGYNQVGKNCVLNCNANEQATDLGTCACVFGFSKPTPNGLCVPRCQQNEDWDGKNCICKAGFAPFNGKCTLCPGDSTSNQFRTSCLCPLSGYIFNPAVFQCVKCPDYSYSSDDDTKCFCNAGYEYNGAICSPICGLNEALNTTTNRCQCKYGYIKVGDLCIERCGLNQEWNGYECLCKQNTIKSNGACKPCGNNLYTNPKRTTCMCSDQKSLFDFNKFSCNPLPGYSNFNDDYTDFVCYAGYKRDGYKCANPCPDGAFPDSTGTCVCSAGLYLSNNQCKKPVTCPAGSTWNEGKLECQCDIQGQYLQDGKCASCGENSVYISSSKQCVCTTGFYLIGGQCIVCDPKTKYNGTDCVCNLGYYGNRDECKKCHESCSICSGPEANQCQACSDVSLVLQKGFCAKNNPCDPGFFLSEDVCTKCTDNCILCESNFDCKTCALGYRVQKVEIGEQKVDICSEVCGDGIKYQDECDDGNTQDGDGCSSSCHIEVGWSCQGGSSARKSNCNKFIPDQTILTSKGVVNLGDKVIQSVRASYLPTCLTDNECAKCFKVLKANVVDANVPVFVKISYIPFSQYQFLIEYNFQGLIVTSKFKTVIKLSEEFKGCLADDDYHQQLQLEIDPAFLAKVDVPEQLDLGEILPATSKQPVVYVPAAAKKALGLSK